MNTTAGATEAFASDTTARKSGVDDTHPAAHSSSAGKTPIIDVFISRFLLF
jgi:hypothetical protein